MKSEIHRIFTEYGINDVGFCDFALIKERLIDCRAKARLPENAKTVILCLFPYKVKHAHPQNISRYAAVPDYHTVCGGYLEAICGSLRRNFTGNRFEWFVDNSPVPEVYAAACAGLGVVGENGLLISKNYGSFVFIGEIVTDLAVKTENKLQKCDACGRCRAACPVGLDKTCCLSAVSQQKKPLSEEQSSALSDCGILWGCDICAESCPMNQNAQTTYIKEFIDGYRDGYTPGEDISGRAYEWRGEKVIKRNYVNLKGGE